MEVKPSLAAVLFRVVPLMVYLIAGWERTEKYPSLDRPSLAPLLAVVFVCWGIAWLIDQHTYKKIEEYNKEQAELKYRNFGEKNKNNH